MALKASIIHEEGVNPVLLTGASGFLGRHIFSFLSEKENTAPGVYDLENTLLPEKGVSEIYHLAALVAYRLEDSRNLFEANVELTKKLAVQYPDARMVMASSISVFGPQNDVLNESSLPGNSSVYGLSKLWAEQWAASLRSHLILRLPSLYGPGMNPATLIPRYFQQAMDTGEIQVWGDGSRQQYYLHASDAARLFRQAMASEKTGVFLGMGSESHSNLELARLIAGITSAKICFTGEDKSHSLRFDSQKTRQELEWKPEISLEQGLEEYYEWKKRQ